MADKIERLSTDIQILGAGGARENSRGAHFRDDFPDPGALDASFYTEIRLADGSIDVERQPVAFTRVRPGERLLTDKGMLPDHGSEPTTA